MVAVVGAGLTLSLDVEPYGPNDSEMAAGRRLLARVMPELGRGFADYLVADGYYATAPFLGSLQRLGLPALVRLKANLPELWRAAQMRFGTVEAHCQIHRGADWIELWDASDFDPWEGLEWTTVRVMRYRHHKPGGETIEAYWLTNLPWQRVSSVELFAMAKSRWEVKNEGFNDAKTRYGMAHIAHHHPNSLLVRWLLLLLALSVERL
jgi:hypothetical protein